MPTLYLNGYRTSARLHNRCVEVSRPGDEPGDPPVHLQVPLFDIERVVVLGRADLTTPILQRLAGQGIPVHFISGKGKWLGSLSPTRDGHALRRLRQYEIAINGGLAMPVAKALVAAKIRNSRRVLQRLAANRELSAAPEQLEATAKLEDINRLATNAADLDTLRGCEGLAAAIYFRRLAIFFPETAPFVERSRRPPRNAANALLSWSYSIVLTEIDAAVRSAGLDPCLGFLHEVSHGRPSLALDLLEPLRAPLCDMLALRLLNHKLIRPEHFRFDSTDGGTYLNDDGRRAYFPEYERTMTRRFAPEKGASHTDFRGAIRDQVHAILRTMEANAEPQFFEMP